MATKKKTVPEAEAAAPAKAAAAKTAAKPAVKKAAVTAAPKRHQKATPAPEAAASVAAPISHEEVSRLAYSYFVARGYQGGSEVEDWLRAERELKERAAGS